MSAAISRQAMRVLVLSQWYSPEQVAPRVVSLAEALHVKGHQVQVVTAFPNYPQGVLYPGYPLRWRRRDLVNGVPVLRLPLYPDHSKSIIRRSAHYLSFSASCMALAPFLAKRPDVIWAYTALAGIPAAWLGLTLRAPFVLEIADLWPETLTATGFFEPGLLTAALDRLGRFVYGRAAGLTVQNQGFKRNLAGKGVPAEKIQVIENTADDKVYRPLPPDPEFGRRYGLIDRFNVIFAGAMGVAQGLGTLMETAGMLKREPDIQLVMIGDGADLERAKSMASSLGADNVRFITSQPPERMPSFFAHAGALLVHLRREPIFELTTPSKTQAYLACAKPVIMAVPGEGARLIREAGAGITCPSEDPRALAAAILQLHRSPAAERARMGEAALALFRARFRPEAALERLEAALVAAARVTR